MSLLFANMYGNPSTLSLYFPSCVTQNFKCFLATPHQFLWSNKKINLSLDCFSNMFNLNPFQRTNVGNLYLKLSVTSERSTARNKALEQSWPPASGRKLKLKNITFITLFLRGVEAKRIRWSFCPKTVYS